MVHAGRAFLSIVVASAALLVAVACTPLDSDERPGSSASPAPAAPDTSEYVPGSSGVGDPYFPQAGNGGIDVEHYDLDLTYVTPRSGADEVTGHLEGTAVLRIRTTENLSQFNLDLRKLVASAVAIDDAPVLFDQEDGELVVLPSAPLVEGRVIEVRIDYAGQKPYREPDRFGGWYSTPGGGVAVNQPNGAPEWFPSNDHPTDKASYRFAITVPEGKTALANGTLVDTLHADGQTTWTWDAPDPMASYLALLAIGDFEIVRSTAPNGIPIIDAIGTGVDPASVSSLALTGEMMTYFEQLYGDYPFVAYGQVVDTYLGTAVETQTRSVFGNGTTIELTVAHELAHQWFGDWVSPGRWSDLWLNEGWAMYSEWMWDEYHNGVTVQSTVDRVLNTGADAPEWATAPAAPDPDDLFSWAVYQRGALTLHALRQRIGDEDFFDVAREWLQRYGGATATTEDFIALTEEVSGLDLSAEFDEWLYQTGRPADW